MSNIPVWYFEEEPKWQALAQLPQRKHNLKTAWAGLKTLPRYQVHIVYPAPWNVAPEQRDTWMDYYLECISLQQDYPARVVLWPLDVWLAEQGVASETLADAHSLNAFMLHGERPDLFELLQALESVACLQAKGQKAARQPALPPQGRQLTELQMKEISLLLSKLAGADALAKQVEALQADLVARQFDADTLRLQLEQASKIDESQLREVEARAHACDEQLKASEVKLREAHSKLNGAEAKAKELEGKLKDIESKAKSADGKVKDLERKNKDLADENKLVLDQLFKVQEELERYFLDNKALKAEARESAKLMKLAAARVLQTSAVDGAKAA